MNRLVGRGGSLGVGGFEGEGDTEGEGEYDGGSGRVVRTIGGGRPPRSGGDLEELDGKWVDRGGGGRGSFDPGPGG